MVDMQPSENDSPEMRARALDDSFVRMTNLWKAIGNEAGVEVLRSDFYRLFFDKKYRSDIPQGFCLGIGVPENVYVDNKKTFPGRNILKFTDSKTGESAFYLLADPPNDKGQQDGDMTVNLRGSSGQFRLGFMQQGTEAPQEMGLTLSHSDINGFRVLAKPSVYSAPPPTI